LGIKKARRKLLSINRALRSMNVILTI